MYAFLFFIARLETVVQGLLLFSFSVRLAKRRPKVSHYVLCLLFFELCSLLRAYTSLPLPSTLLCALFLYGANVFWLGRGHLVSCLTAMLSISTMQLSYGVFSEPMALLLPYLEEGTPPVQLVGLFTSVLSLILFFCCCLLISRRFPLEEEDSRSCLLLLLTPVAFFCVVEPFLVNTIYGNVAIMPVPFDPEKSLGLLAVHLLGFGALFSNLYAYRRLCDHFSVKSRLALLEQETRAQRAYVAEAEARYGQTASFRHDVKNHLTVLDGLLGAAQPEQARAYLKKLESATAELSLPVQTGSPVVDILLGSKLELAGRKGLKADCSLRLPQPCTVDELDLCVIFSNALDNAIRACASLRETGTIRISGERQGDFYLLEFENDCPPEQGSAVEPGVGLSNVKTVAEKYGGAITIECGDGRFCLDVLLHIPQ